MKLVFCSCSKLQSYTPQPVWNRIRAESPDVLLMLGDNIYLDNDNHDDPAALSAELRQLYQAQLGEPNFAALKSDLALRGAAVIATYDDHDCVGNNRGGADSPSALRDAARRELVTAFAPPMTGADVYSVSQFGVVRLIVLDTRYYRSDATTSNNDRNGILGGQQWTWLEALLQTPAATPFTVVATSTPVHRFGENESWEDHPGAFIRLRDLVAGRAGTLVVSGDIHHNDQYDDSGVVELVSSGVSRKGWVFGGKRENYGVLTFDATGVDVKFEGLKHRERASFRVNLSAWHL
jgi:phosphodiesterase/alkaline phosphatase D-like protein